MARFNQSIVDIDPEAETARIVEFLRRNVRREMKRRGAVVGISGGIDSAVVLALSVRAFGAGGVLLLFALLFRGEGRAAEPSAAPAVLDSQVWGQGFEAPVFCDEVDVLLDQVLAQFHELLFRAEFLFRAHRDILTIS